MSATTIILTSMRSPLGWLESLPILGLILHANRDSRQTITMYELNLRFESLSTSVRADSPTSRISQIIFALPGLIPDDD